MIKCSVCKTKPAPYPGKSLLTPEQLKRIDEFNASYYDKDGKSIFHTGHISVDLMELPRHLCEKCYTEEQGK